MDLGLKEQTAIIIGASRGIGKATALALASEGCHVAICARGEEALYATAHQLEAKGVRVHAAICDAADPAALDAFLDSARETLGEIHILVNNASAFAFGAGEEDWRRSFEIDLLAAVHATGRVIPWFLASGSGTIIHVSSTAALEAPSPLAYSAMKAALLSHAKNVAVAHAAGGIRVNCVAPGAVEFPGGIWDDAKKNNPEFYQEMLASVPGGRMVNDKEVAAAIVFLASPLASGINGAVLAVDAAQHKGNL
ncbi:MAG: SDR family oxidoreductase [Deltaproteobacteria bacterium]